MTKSNSKEWSRLITRELDAPTHKQDILNMSKVQLRKFKIKHTNKQIRLGLTIMVRSSWKPKGDYHSYKSIIKKNNMYKFIK